ncbi:MAG: WXG100 family type VII secretion target [Desertimonas sp.]
MTAGTATVVPAVVPTSSDGASFTVVPAELVGAAGALDAEAEAMQLALERLRHRLADLGPAWGIDVVGQRFGAHYQPVSERVQANVGAMATGLVRIAAALRAVANSYEVADGPADRSGTTS